MTAHGQVLDLMKEMKKKFSEQGVDLRLPPPSSLVLRTNFTEIEAGRMLAAEFPFNPDFTNPIGLFQGGLLCALFDEVYGPLTYMAAGRPVVTIEMSTSFIRPFTKNDETLRVRAEIVSRTSSLIVMRAEATNKEGKLIATSSNHSMILNDRKA